MRPRLAAMAVLIPFAIGSLAACGRAATTVATTTVPTVAPATVVPTSAAPSTLATTSVTSPPPSVATTPKPTAAPRKAQTISAQPIAGWTFGTVRPVAASATSGLPVTLAKAIGSCAIENATLLTLKATGVGPCTVRFSQDDATGQFQHADFDFTYTVDPAEQQITGVTTQFRLNVTTIANGRTTYNLQASAPGGVSFISRAPGDDCTVSGSVLSVRNYVWSCPVSVVAGGTGYKPASLDLLITILPQIVTVAVAVKAGPAAGQWNVRAVETINGVGRVLTKADTGCTVVSTGASGMVVSLAAGNASCTMTFNVGLEDGLREKDCKQANLPTGTVTPCN